MIHVGQWHEDLEVLRQAADGIDLDICQLGNSMHRIRDPLCHYCIIKRLKLPNTPAKLLRRPFDLLSSQLPFLDQAQVSSICSQTLGINLRLSHPRLLSLNASVVLFHGSEKVLVRREKRPKICCSSSADEPGVPVDEGAVDIEGESLDFGPVDGGGL